MAILVTSIVAVISAVLTAVGIYVTISLKNLYLPVPSLIYVLPVLLPLTLLLITLIVPIPSSPITYPNGMDESSRMAGTLVLRRGTSLFASLMQLAQAALSIILVALAAPYLPADSESTSCALSTSWQKSWHQHSVVIREIQDQLGCCGYRSLKDRAWPFPTGTKPDPLQCAKQFHRKISCAGPWNEELRRKVGVTLGIGVVVAVLQLANFLYGSSTLWSERLFQSNPFDWVKRRQNQSDNATFTRRLLTGGDEEETRVESYHDFEDSAARQNHSSTESGDNARPRVEPTIHGAHESHESSAWRQN